VLEKECRVTSQQIHYTNIEQSTSNVESASQRVNRCATGASAAEIYMMFRIVSGEMP